jgi:hypothetical protein
MRKQMNVDTLDDHLIMDHKLKFFDFLKALEHWKNKKQEG